MKQNQNFLIVSFLTETIDVSSGCFTRFHAKFYQSVIFNFGIASSRSISYLCRFMLYNFIWFCEDCMVVSLKENISTFLLRIENKQRRCVITWKIRYSHPSVFILFLQTRLEIKGRKITLVLRVVITILFYTF